ncbi:MAG: hypothetical protein HZB55_00930 [Deltaproteobacteria bacterium]|nr:hypothetical protein [Deltaproteobacteria bacterium]
MSLEVGDPVLPCPFCRTSLYLSPGRPLRYRLAAALGVATEPTFHLPFWRIRGVRYRAAAEPAGVEGNLLDATVPAWQGAPAGANLGVRPQAAHLTLVSGRGATPDVSADEAQAVAEARYDRLEPARALFTRLIGETRSLIEAPFLLEEGPTGGRLREALPDATSYPLDPPAVQAVRALGERAPAEEPAPFLPLLCPECGHGLPAASGAAAFLCGQCTRCWRVTAQGLAPLTVFGAPGGSRDARLFPFWHLAFAAEGLPFTSRAELRRWAIPYQPAPTGWEGEPPSLLVPAFKAQPRTFLRTAKAMSIAPLAAPGALSPGRVLDAEPVRLPITEAAQALKPVLAHLVETFRRSYPAVAPAKLRITGADLWFLPFEPRGAEWIHASTGFALQATSVRHGARL